ncbi:MAG: hypothetical protein LBJ00_13120 [Planctomycetaceae bacterium]|jgi:3-oxoacyl-(acyl-carrier-protein) synthase|nr:hypothetical protein [Planctomycetaceae bacterium]
MKKSLSSEAIAVVAMSCRLPSADSPQAFWQILADSNSPICEVPETWLNHEIYFDPQAGKIGKTYSKLGAIFDSEKIENEIKNYHFHKQFRNRDPLLKLACIVADEVVGRVVFPAGCNDFGIYLGGLRASDLSHDYILSYTISTVFELLYDLPEFSELPAQIQHDIMSQCIHEAEQKYRNENYWRCESPEFRLSDFVSDLRKVYGWSGAAYSLDAACASSLVAIDCARADILAGKIQGALVGGISAMTMLTPILFSKNFAATQTLSRPFDAEADGMVGSMGIVFAFLKSLSSAERDGDEILGLIRGIGFSSDGRGKSLWAPRLEGELTAMKRAYRGTKITPQQLNYLEAHATSTNVGDSTELKSIENLLNCSQSELLSDFSTNAEDVISELTYNNLSTESEPATINVTKNHNARKLAIGSVKANFGHAFEAAGFVGLMKVVQICRNKIIPPQINISELHSDFRERRLPFFVPRESVQLNDSDNALLFGVNAFGVGGLNAHLIFEEYKKDQSPTTNQNEQPNQIPAAIARVPIAVIGIGCVYPHAFSVEQFRTTLKQNSDPKQQLSPFEFKRRFFSEPKNADDTAVYGGFIENYLYDWERHKIPPLQIQRCDPLQTYVMGAVDEAMSSAITGRMLSDVERDKTFVVAGSEHLSNFFYEFQLGMRAQEFGQIARNSATINLTSTDNTNKFADTETVAQNIAKNFVKKILRENPAVSDVTGGFSSSSLASRITKLYDLHGGAFTIDGGFVSSLIAVDYSLQKLRRGDCLFGICIGAYRWTNAHAFEFYQSKYKDTKFQLAEGAGAVVLKSLDRVDRANEKPLGLIYDLVRVAGGKLDESVWSSLNLAIDDLQFVSITSPTLSKHLYPLEEFFRNEKRSHPIPITTCNDQFGNFCAGAGMAELIKTLLILQDREIPPQFGEKNKPDETSLFFVTKNKLELNLNERSFAVLFDLDENGNGYAAVILPFIVAQNKIEIETEGETFTMKPRQIQRSKLSRLLDAELAADEVAKYVYVYRQIGTSYDFGFGLGVADADEIEAMIQAFDEIPQNDGFDETFKFGEMLSLGRELFGESGIDEMRGLSDGSGVPFEKLFLHNIRFYLGLRGVQFLLRDAGVFRHVVIFEHPMREIIGGKLDVHLSECEPAASEAYLRAAATGCIGGFAASKSELSVSILPKPQTQNSHNKINFTHNSNLMPFVNIATFLNQTANIKNISPDPTNPTANILIASTLTGNFTNSTQIQEHNLKTTQNLIQKYSSTPQYFCTIMFWHNGIEIL